MRLIAVMLTLSACGSPCEPFPCTVDVSASLSACGCGQRYCQVCICNTPGCELSGGGPGHSEYLDCDSLKVVKRSCPAEGYP